MPPGVPADRAAALKEAFRAMLKDEIFLDQARKLELPIEPILGNDLDRFVADVVGTPPVVIERVKTLLYGK
jgi:tripartite-type tricarboxylate transporter receptor subunit TctC